MRNLDSMLKSRDLTPPTKAHVVKAMVFPVVTYGCESWTVKKTECQRFDVFELWFCRRLQYFFKAELFSLLIYYQLTKKDIGKCSFEVATFFVINV